VPQKIVNDIPEIPTTPESFLPNKTFHEMQLQNTSQAEIVSIIRAMQSKSSTDLDGIPMKVLKLVALEIGLPLSHICNLSLSSGIFPNSNSNSNSKEFYSEITVYRGLQMLITILYNVP
jgi:hypothetical protein